LTPPRVAGTLAANEDTVPAPEFGHALNRITVNLLVRDVAREVAFLTAVFGLAAHRVSTDFAILLHAGQPLQLHSDATYARHPLPSLLPEAGARGAGIEIRLHEADPDVAAQVAAGIEGAVILMPPADKPAHGLREAVILSPSGYAFVPSRRI
jgi:catechol 2,3-dioxygenase-like lactoylglutathione lyase family enzyme